MPITPFQEHRNRLKRNPACRFIPFDQFCRLATSRMSLVRRDEPDAALLGLFDTEAGVQYVTEEENLLSHFTANPR